MAITTATIGLAPVNGIELAYEIHGNGKPLVLLHGGFGAAGMFGPNISALAVGRQVISVDLQSHGARQNQVAALLANGRVLVAGGNVDTGSRLVSAELYDPATGRFSPTGNMTTERVGPTATTLLDGRVLIVGGNVTGIGLDNEAELYLP